MGKNYNKKVLLAKLEGTEGTDSTPVVATDAFKVINFRPSFLQTEQRRRTVELPYFGSRKAVLAAFRRGCAFDIEMTGSGGLATAAPAWMKLLRFGGMDAGVAGAGSVVQSPITDAIPSASLYYIIDDLRMKTLGARASIGFVIEDDDFARWTLNFLGSAPTVLADEAAPGAVTYPTLAEPLLASSENTTFTLDGYALPLRRIEATSNGDLQYRSLIGPQDRTKLADRPWSATIVAQLPNLTDKDYFTKIRAGDTMPIAITHGAAAGNTVDIDVPAFQVTGDPEISEEQGEVMLTLPGDFIPVNGNDEVVITTS